MNAYKFGWLPDGEHEERYEYGNLWAIEKTTGPDRLAIAPRVGYVDLLLALAKTLEEPFLVLYVLVVPRDGGEAGRYQSEFSLSFEDLQHFLKKFKGLLEDDGRNNIWIRSESGLLVYDRHNVIYAYGPLAQFSSVALATGLTEASEVRFPDPHAHHYNDEFDDDQACILKEMEWIYSPLRPGDENPV